MSSKTRVAIIGAGAAGLSALKHLLYHHSSNFEVVAFERNGRVGGVWFHTPDTNKTPLHSAVYDNLRTNLPKEIMQYEDFPFAEDLPSYIHHSEVMKYLERFADHFDLNQYIKFNTEVVEVTPKPCASSFLDGTVWLITTKNLETGAETTEQFDAVLVCNGHFTVPHYNVKGMDNFQGSLIHSQAYRNPAPYKSKTVLVVGNAASGTDIGLEVAKVAKRVYISQRKAPTINVFWPNNLTIVSGTDSILKDGSVLLDNDEILDVDCVIVCTGYKYEFPFLSQDCGITVTDNRVQPLYKHIFNTEYPSMAFIGLNLLVLALFNFDTQMKYVAAVFSGSASLPSKEVMREDEEAEFQSVLDEGFKTRDAHMLAERQWDYCRTLAELGGFDEYEPIIEKIFIQACQNRKRKVTNYKDHTIVIIDRKNCLFRFYLNF